MENENGFCSCLFPSQKPAKSIGRCAITANLKKISITKEKNFSHLHSLIFRERKKNFFPFEKFLKLFVIDILCFFILKYQIYLKRKRDFHEVKTFIEISYWINYLYCQWHLSFLTFLTLDGKIYWNVKK